jgi:hypothetical protein
LTAVIPPVSAADKFGTTADLSGAAAAARARRGRMASVLAGLLLVGAAAAAYKVTNGQKAPGSTGNAVASASAPTLPAAPPITAPPAVATAPTPEPPPPPEEPAAPEPLAAAPQPAAVEPPRAAAPPRASAKRHHERVRHAAAAVALPAPASEPVPAVAAKAAPPPAPAPTLPDAPPMRGPREVLAEAERLLGQGEVGEACARGEEAKRLGPKHAPVFKFLGKCYMRAGRAPQARENYEHYLELAPTASDAPFIKSMLK